MKKWLNGRALRKAAADFVKASAGTVFVGGVAFAVVGNYVSAALMFAAAFSAFVAAANIDGDN